MQHRTEQTEAELAAEAAGVPMMKERRCPQCGSDDIGKGHHEGDWHLPEFSWNECNECEFRFGGDGAYQDAKPDPNYCREEIVCPGTRMAAGDPGYNPGAHSWGPGDKCRQCGEVRDDE